MLRSVLNCTKLSAAFKRSLCAKLTPPFRRGIAPVGSIEEGDSRKAMVAKGKREAAGIRVGSSIQQLVQEIALIKEEVEEVGRSMEFLATLAGEVKENEDICSLFCSQRIVCEAERDFSYLFIRSQCGDSTGDDKYIYVNTSGEIKSATLQLPDIPMAIVKEVTIHMPQPSPPTEVHLYLSNGYLLACSQDTERTNTIQTLQGIEHVLDSATWFLRDPITMGTTVAFLRPFMHQQLVVHCTASTPLQLDSETAHPTPTPNLRFQAI